MCLILVNSVADQALNSLQKSSDKYMIERRMYDFADVANKQVEGPLDKTANRLRYSPPDLRGIRKQRVGRHRVFYTGHHSQCSYDVFFVKKFKKNDKEHEGSKRFQNRLRQALSDPSIRRITSGDDK